MIPRETSNPGQRARHEPLFDVHPQTGATVEVFYADRSLETFGRCGAGWFWWPRRRGFTPDGPPTGPFVTSYSAYRHAMRGRGVISCLDAHPMRHWIEE
jgi:hypothetical protein